MTLFAKQYVRRPFMSLCCTSGMALRVRVRPVPAPDPGVLRIPDVAHGSLDQQDTIAAALITCFGLATLAVNCVYLSA